MRRIYNGERIVSSTDDIEKTGYPHAKIFKKVLGPILHHTQKATQIGIKTWMKDLKL